MELDAASPKEDPRPRADDPKPPMEAMAEWWCMDAAPPAVTNPPAPIEVACGCACGCGCACACIWPL